MTTRTLFQINKNNLSDTNIKSETLPDLKDGQVLLKVDRFSFTANNVTYAVMGDKLKYWDFFPTDDGYGIIPVWGFANVIETKCDSIEVGEKFYGYLPMGTHLIVEPEKISALSFIDGADHREHLSMIYNQYVRSANDPIYREETEALQMLLRPLFTTSFLLDDFYDDNSFFGADSVILTSASSKTALGMAFLLHRNRARRSNDYEIVGLTSPANLDFVKSLGCYDQVISYDQINLLDNKQTFSSVDFAGNGEVLGNIHNHLADNLKYSCLVGASHWEDRGGLPQDLKGPSPILFFAPSQAEKRLKEWGGAGFQQRLGTVWNEFSDFVDGWINVVTETGTEGMAKSYDEVLTGKSTPDRGIIVSV